MRGTLEIAPTATVEAETSEERVSVWADSVGVALWQIGVIATGIAVVRLASDLLFG